MKAFVLGYAVEDYSYLRVQLYYIPELKNEVIFCAP